MEAVPRPRELSEATGRGGVEWIVDRVVGDLAAFHADDPTPRRSATIVEADRPTLVLGSSQRDDAVDRRVAQALGIEVVRRRSGGGAVLLMPGEFAWVDLVVPAGDPLWSDDVAAAMHWVGALWVSALGSLGVEGVTHTGPMVRSPWSDVVCFAGRGTAEVFAAAAPGRKLVGISQRRTRNWARFQTMCHVRWRPELVAALAAPPRPAAVDLVGVADLVPGEPGGIVGAVLAGLPD